MSIQSKFEAMTKPTIRTPNPRGILRKFKGHDKFSPGRTAQELTEENSVRRTSTARVVTRLRIGSTLATPKTVPWEDRVRYGTFKCLYIGTASAPCFQTCARRRLAIYKLLLSRPSTRAPPAYQPSFLILVPQRASCFSFVFRSLFLRQFRPLRASLVDLLASHFTLAVNTSTSSLLRRSWLSPAAPLLI